MLLMTLKISLQDICVRHNRIPEKTCTPGNAVTDDKM